MSSSARNFSSASVPFRMLRIRTWMCARLLPGVRWCSSRIRNRSLPTLISIPLRRRVAWIDDAIYPLYILAIVAHMVSYATMRDVAFTRWDPLRDLLTLHEQIGQL